MKKLLSLLFFVGTLGLAAQSTVHIDVYGTSSIHQGVAVFLYEAPSSMTWGTVTDPTTFTQIGYTDANGEVSFNVASADTVAYGTFDCNGQFYQKHSINVQSMPNQRDTLIYNTCVPDDCDALLVSGTTGSGLDVEAYALRDVAYISTNPNSITHTFELNGTTYFGSLSSFNYSLLQVSGVSLPTGSPIYVEYWRDTVACSSQQVVDTAYYQGGLTLSCTASYFIDTVNSGNFQGQLILGENSTTSSGSIVNWSWDFGDGTVINTQYPTHTYPSVAASYVVCLTITGVDGMDTCMSTYCDTVQFDSTGAPVFKTGFTVNVLDPNTFSIENPLLESITMYPNPSQGEAQITWNAALDVDVLEVFNTNGQRMMIVEPTENVVRFQSMPSGVFLIRIQTANSVVSRRLIVQ